MEKGNFMQAVDHIQKALSLMPFPEKQFQFTQINGLFMDSLALAYYKAGDLDNALKQYEKIIALTPGNLFYGDIYSKSLYMLGKIHQEQGNAAKAKEHYRNFLDLWKDADPSLPEVEDARRRLAGLRQYAHF